MGSTIKITLPIPDSRIAPNSRKHYMAQNKIRGKHRELAKATAMALAPKKPLENVMLVRTFYLKNKRRRDGDNLASACKAYLDGIVDAKVIKDDSFSVIGILVTQFGGIDKGNPRVEFEFTEI